MVNYSLTDGYIVKSYPIPTHRFCQTLDLRDDPELIAMYRKIHSNEHIWVEILEGIKSVGILEMEIYLLGTRLFMILEMPIDLEWDNVMNRLGKLPRQEEWEAYTAHFQKADSSASSAEKWQLMESIFHLYE